MVNDFDCIVIDGIKALIAIDCLCYSSLLIDFGAVWLQIVSLRMNNQESFYWSFELLKSF